MVIDYHLHIKDNHAFFFFILHLVNRFLPPLSQNTRLSSPKPPRSLKSSSFWVIQSLNSSISNLLFSLIYSFFTKSLSIKNPQFLKPYHGIFKKTFKAHNQEESS